MARVHFSQTPVPSCLASMGHSTHCPSSNLTTVSNLSLLSPYWFFCNTASVLCFGFLAARLVGSQLSDWVELAPLALDDEVLASGPPRKPLRLPVFCFHLPIFCLNVLKLSASIGNDELVDNYNRSIKSRTISSVLSLRQDDNQDQVKYSYLQKDLWKSGALGWPRGMGWGGRWERSSGWGTHVHLWWIHINVWQNHYNIVISLL